MVRCHWLFLYRIKSLMLIRFHRHCMREACRGGTYEVPIQSQLIRSMSVYHNLHQIINGNVFHLKKHFGKLFDRQSNLDPKLLHGLLKQTLPAINDFHKQPLVLLLQIPLKKISNFTVLSWALVHVSCTHSSKKIHKISNSNRLILPCWHRPGSRGSRRADWRPQAAAAHSWWLCHPSAEAAMPNPLWVKNRHNT